MSDSESRNLGLGILAGISTGVFWGLPFVVPQILGDYHSIEVVFGRFFFFGLFSFFFIKPVMKIFRQLSPSDRWKILILSAAGFWFYAILLFWAVQQTDGVISSLIIGLIPVVVPIFSPERKKGGFGFYSGLFLLLIGILNLLMFPWLTGMLELKVPSAGGVLALVICLILWSWYVIGNTQFLRQHRQINRKYFASVLGVVSLFCTAPLFLMKVDFPALVSKPDFPVFLFCSVLLGFGSSWFANWLWNICSHHCPPEISGPLIISETLFGLFYSFIFQKRLPYGYEWFSIGFFLIGVYLTLRSQIRISRSS